MAKLRQLKRQRASDIGKPTGLGIGDRFGGDHEQIQGMLGHRRHTGYITLACIIHDGSSRNRPKARSS